MLRALSIKGTNILFPFLRMSNLGPSDYLKRKTSNSEFTLSPLFLNVHIKNTLLQEVPVSRILIVENFSEPPPT